MVVGSLTAAQLGSIPNSAASNANYDRRDRWEAGDNNKGALPIANAPNNQQIALSSILGQDADTSRDAGMWPISWPDFDWQNSGSITPFFSGGDPFFPTNAPARSLSSAPSNNHLLTANTNSLPQITTPSGTRTISHIHLRNDETFDAIGFA